MNVASNLEERLLLLPLLLLLLGRVRMNFPIQILKALHLILTVVMGLEHLMIMKRIYRLGLTQILTFRMG